MGFQEICEDVVRDTDGALGCILIDLRTGLALAAAQRTGGGLEHTDVNTVLYSSGDMFRGKLIDQFVQSLPTNRASSAGFVREVQITTRYTHQFMVAMSDWESGVTILITEKTLSLGLGWMAVHRAQERLAESYRSAGQEARSPMRDARSEAMSTPAMPFPSMSSKPMDVPTPPQPQSPRPPTHDEVPAARSEPGSPTKSERDTVPAHSEARPVDVDDHAEPERQVVSGPRASMFRGRQGKSKNQ